MNRATLPPALKEAFEQLQTDLVQGQPVAFPERLGDTYEGLRAGSLERRQGVPITRQRP